MNLKNSPEIQENEWVLSLIKTFIYSIYIENWNTNSQNIIQIKNKLAIEMASLYDKMIKDYQKWNISKTFILEFNALVLNQFLKILEDFKKDAFDKLYKINKSKAQNEEQKIEIKKYIENHIDKIIQIAKNEIDIIIEQFNKKCMEILIDSSNVSKKLLSASHERSLSRINWLREETQKLVSQITSLQTDNSSLSNQVELLNSTNSSLQATIKERDITIAEQSKRLVKIFKNWRTLNTKVWALEKEKIWLLETLSEIDSELAKKWEQEVVWRKGIERHQRFDEIETELRKEIEIREKLLSSARETISYLEGIISKNNGIISWNENEIKELLKTTLSDYFYFIIENNGFLNQEKVKSYEDNIKQVYYRAKMMNFEVNDFILDFIKNLVSNYENNPKYSKEILDLWYKELISFLNSLIYWKNYIDNAQKTYKDIYTMS